MRATGLRISRLKTEFQKENKGGKLMRFEKFLKVVVAGELIGIGCIVLRGLVATKSSPASGDDYEDSYEAGFEAATARMKMKSRRALLR